MLGELGQLRKGHDKMTRWEGIVAKSAVVIQRLCKDMGTNIIDSFVYLFVLLSRSSSNITLMTSVYKTGHNL